MPDILIRDVPPHVVATIEANAEHQGLSRAEYLRRVLARERDRRQRVTREDFERLAEICTDALDPDIMAGAWR